MIKTVIIVMDLNDTMAINSSFSNLALQIIN